MALYLHISSVLSKVPVHFITTHVSNYTHNNAAATGRLAWQQHKTSIDLPNCVCFVVCLTMMLYCSVKCNVTLETLLQSTYTYTAEDT